jgi:diamine N-acetyltransferase
LERSLAEPLKERHVSSQSPQVTFREITVDTVDEVLALRVAPDQEGCVATNAKSIAQAHYYPEIAWFRAVYAGETLVGFVMISDKPKEHEYFLWRLMIAEPFQGLGYGRRTMELVIDHVRTRPGATCLLTSVVPGQEAPRRFYEHLGFVDTGEVDDGEPVLRYDL